MNKTVVLISSLLAGIFGLYVIGCIFSPSTMTDKGEIKIKCTKGLLGVMINDIKEWPKWLSWKNEDPELSISLGGRHVNQGANFTFEGPIFGKGRVELEESLKDSLMAAQIINDQWPAKVVVTFQIIPESNSSVLLTTRSRIVSKIPFFKRVLYRNFQAEYRNRHQEDLAGLKNYIEGMINTQFGADATTFPKKYYVGVKAPIYNMNIPKFYAENFPKVYKLLDSMQIKQSGPPVGLIYDWEGGSNYVYIMAALPVEQKFKPPTGFELEEVPEIPCVKLEVFGHYNNLKTAHVKMDYFMNTSSFTLFPPIIEEYVTNPNEEPDTTKWLTNVYYLLDNTGSYAKELSRKKTMEDMLKEEDEQRKKNIEQQNKLRR
ncbi:MAG: GyrI-like domain-containing protein [Saprospiraceae bacterium]|nr:GyrI-like domain-containing protein [Saprospiraceae bacterium]